MAKIDTDVDIESEHEDFNSLLPFYSPYFNNKYRSFCQIDIFSKWFVMLGFWAFEMDSYLSSSG
jgi:hypothetical protein